jgi:hypothetical protein
VVAVGGVVGVGVIGSGDGVGVGVGVVGGACGGAGVGAGVVATVHLPAESGVGAGAPLAPAGHVAQTTLASPVPGVAGARQEATVAQVPMGQFVHNWPL